MKKLNKNKIYSSTKTNEILFNSGYAFDGVPEDPMYMSEEELMYIASVIHELTSLNLQRSIFQMIHTSCDYDTIFRFHKLFTARDIDYIMISC